MPPAKKAAPRKPKPEPEPEPEDDHEARPWDPGAGYG